MEENTVYESVLGGGGGEGGGGQHGFKPKLK